MNASAPGELNGLRAEVEQLDHDLIELLARRARLASRIGECKRASGQPVLDPAREAAVVRRAAALAAANALPEESVRAVFWQIIGLCRRAQED